MTHPACAVHDAIASRPLHRARRIVARRIAAGMALCAPLGAFAQATAPAQPGATAQLDIGDVFRRLDTTGLLLIALSALFVLWFVWRIVRMVGRDRAPRLPAARKTAPRAGSGSISASTAGPSSVLRDSLNAATDWGFDENKRSAVGRRKGMSEDPTLTAIDRSTMMPAITGSTGTRGVVPDDSLGRSPVPTVSPYRTGTNPYYLRSEPVDSRIDVEEVADVLTQAELLVQLGDPKEAMGLLSRHIRETEKPGPQVWLMLLDLYRSTGREAQYNTLGDGFRALFNAQVPPWSTSSAGDRLLADYPQVMQRLQATWPTDECRAGLDALLNDDRGGSRQGFSLAAYREILFLVEILDARIVLDREEVDRADIARKLTIQR